MSNSHNSGRIPPPAVSDSPMWDRLMGNYNFACLKVAAQLDITGLINQGHDTVSALSQKLELSDKGLGYFLLILSHLGYIHFDKQKLKNTELGKCYLGRDSNYYWGEVLLDPFLIYDINHLDKKILTSLKRVYELECAGRSVTDMWQNNDMDNNSAAAFTHLMHSQGFASAVEAVSLGLFDKSQTLLDAGGGSGTVALAFTDHYPERRALLFDLAPVCNTAKIYIKKFDKNQRIDLIEGDFFKGEWPRGCDGICFSNVLHDWQSDTCQSLVNKAFALLPSGGQIFIHDMLFDDTRITPILFCFHLFMNHGSQLFSKEQLYRLLKEAGFTKPKNYQALGYFSVISAVKP
ncbi:methyltransferase domain-containing protein [Microbulbifer sp. OS29]|uniref:Methyltransferase domain-containing protein n=1 Tax=Microbulbifer okhotskensis TaxID=2926617 RepID=A0A9X2ENS2_9GAMM|nr:methyltransferase [Microbulbifer okhotskensis]MCO1335647.1 methyltransferase domain-containing protein [Microbulbifer okhotskensis]